MIVKILFFVAIILAAFAVYVSMQPNDFSLARNTTISAPPSVVFAQVNDLHKWEAWSPWAKLDPAATNQYSGSPSGPGASMSWSSEKRDVGAGKMTIVETRPDEFIRINLEFKKPFEGTNVVEFKFKSEHDQTTVSWFMSGKRNFVFKAMGVFMDCDKMVGDQFNQGLASLKSVSEAASK